MVKQAFKLFLVGLAVLLPIYVFADTCFGTWSPTPNTYGGYLTWSGDAMYDGQGQGFQNPTFFAYTVQYFQYSDATYTTLTGSGQTYCDNSQPCGIVAGGNDRYWKFTFDEYPGQPARVATDAYMGFVTGIAAGVNWGCITISGTGTGIETHSHFTVEFMDQEGTWVNLVDTVPEIADNITMTADFEIIDSACNILVGYNLLDCEFEIATTSDIGISIAQLTDGFGFTWTFDSGIMSDVSPGSDDYFIRDDPIPTKDDWIFQAFSLFAGWGNDEGGIGDTPTVPIEGGTYPYYYNFDGMGCEAGGVYAFFRSYFPEGYAIPPWPQSASWSTQVWPQSSTEFNGYVNITVPPSQAGETVEARIKTGCTTDRNDWSAWIDGVEQDYTLVTEVPTTTPCDGLSALDLPGVFSCGWWRFTTLVNDVFMPGDISASAINETKNLIDQKFPFIMFDGFITQFQIIQSWVDIPRGTMPVFTYTSDAANAEIVVDLSDYSVFWDLFYSAEMFMLIFATIWYVARDLHIISGSSSGPTVTYYDNDDFI